MTIHISSGQDKKTEYFNAINDTTYYKQVTQIISNKTGYCKIPNINWTSECNNPRTLSLVISIKLTKQGIIESVNFSKAEFSYKNESGKIVSEDLIKNAGPFEDFTGCIINTIIAIKSIDPLTINNEKKNTEIIYAFKIDL